ncbi:MAG: DUF1566 domain-containing protein [bacterium]
MIRSKQLAAIYCVLVVCALPTYGATWYVATTGNNGSAGTNWTTAKATIQAGVNAAANGDAVQVRSGVYSGAGNRDLVISNKTITVVAETASNMPTIDCGNVRIMSILSNANVQISGFAIRNAYLSFGGDWAADGLIKIASSQARFERLAIVSNTTYTSYVTTRLSVIDAQSSTVSVQNCLIACNTLGGSGSATFGAGSDLIYSRGNSSFISVDSSTFSSNNFGSGGLNWVADVTEMRNSIVYGNMTSGSPTPPTVRTNRSGAFASYSCIEGGFVGTGNITNSPLFQNPPAGDFRLTDVSPCIERGSSSLVSGLSDLDGKWRILGAAVDMGAYEWGVVPSNSILGTITYDGAQTGKVIVSAAPYVVTNEGLGVYQFDNVAIHQSYSIEAFRDSNGSGTRDYWEAWGTYSNNPIYLTNGASFVNVSLMDPDHDADGHLDWVELQNGTDPYNPSSRVTVISGTISYSGYQTGLVKVVSTSSLETNVMMRTTPGSYQLSNRMTRANYIITAYRDYNGNGAQEGWEACGVYSNNPVYLTNDMSEINITMLDPDINNDGIPDWLVSEVIVTNLVVAQRPGTKLVDITFDVSSHTNRVYISLNVSNANVQVNTPNLVGSVGYVLSGTGKSIVWNMGADWNGNLGELTFTVTARVLLPPPGGDSSAIAWSIVDGRWIRNYYADGAVTMTDVSNNLMWVYNASANGAQNWNNSVNYCNNLSYAGYTDWYLPSKDQLLAMRSQTAVFIDVGDTYWSSTTYSALSYVVSMSLGAIADGRSISYGIWPCRAK